MIDATKITDYNLTYPELQERLLFWILAAGKSGVRSANIVNQWVSEVKQTEYIFDTLKRFSLDNLIYLCTKYKTGCQNYKARSIYEAVNSDIDLANCTPDELETIFGIGMKTSRCFIIHSRMNAPYAGLDTHILKYLRDNGYNAPKQTPTRKKYLELEKIFINLATRANKSIAEFDLDIWNYYRK